MQAKALEKQKSSSSNASGKQFWAKGTGYGSSYDDNSNQWSHVTYMKQQDAKSRQVYHLNLIIIINQGNHLIPSNPSGYLSIVLDAHVVGCLERLFEWMDGKCPRSIGRVVESVLFDSLLRMLSQERFFVGHGKTNLSLSFYSSR